MADSQSQCFIDRQRKFTDVLVLTKYDRENERRLDQKRKTRFIALGKCKKSTREFESMYNLTKLSKRITTLKDSHETSEIKTNVLD